MVRQTKSIFAAIIMVSLLLVNTSSSFAQVCVTPPSGMTSWWPGDGNANDIVGTNSGIVFGPTFTPGKVGQAFTFNGAPEYVKVLNSPSLNVGTGDLSIDAWVKTTGSGLELIVDKREFPNLPTNNGVKGYGLFLYNGFLGFQMADGLGSSYTNFISSIGAVNDGAFHHVAVTVDRSSNSGGKLYVDGNVVLTFDPTVRSASLDNTGDLRIGRLVPQSTEAGFNGQIDEVEFFKHALTQIQIQSIVDAGSAGKCKISDPPARAVGGMILPVDMTALFIVGAMANAFWMVPTLGGIGAALVLFKVKRKHD